MKRPNQEFYKTIINWPNNFSILEILIIIIGMAVGALIYFQTSQIRIEAENARTFDQENRKMLLALSIANIRFSELIEGNSMFNLEEDIYSQLDIAESLCDNIEQGGPSGQFMPTPEAQEKIQEEVGSICEQLQVFRGLMQQRWQDHLDGKPDSQREAYETSFEQTLEAMQRFNGAADPHLQEAESKTRITNLEMSIGLAGIFIVIAFIIWRTRKAMAKQWKLLEAENELRTRLNTELDSERNLVNTLIDNLPDAVFAKDCQERFLVANPAAARVMGVPRKEDMIGKSSSDFQPQEIAEKIHTMDSHILESGEAVLNQQELLMNLTKGDTFWAQTTKVVLRDRVGQIIGLVGISRDITGQREAEEALQKANDQLIVGIATLEQSTHESERLSEMVDLLQACPNTEEACVVIANQMEKFFPEDAGALYLFHASRNILDRAASWGPPLPDPAVFKPDECWGLRRGRMHIVEGKSGSSKQPGNTQALLCPHISSDDSSAYLCVPLVAQGEALGLIHLRHRLEAEPKEVWMNRGEWYDHMKRRRIHTIIDSLSLALANLKLRSSLRQQSIRDPLTGMFNRRYMEETLEREILRATRSNETVGVIMLDIDHFKRFNDTFGHQAGDVLLTSLGHFFLSHVRGEDVACRYGGEEFILLLPGTNIERACQRAEELREKVHYLNAVYQGQSLGTITLSFGVAAFPQHGTTSELVVHAADQALYRAKMEGRDRMVVA
jgi:diguanylate cyclase (GGDEF)-like protein/PAS domain S-box-containing protein